jgi:hypothetical protein
VIPPDTEDSTERLIEMLREIEREGDRDKRVNMLADFTYGTAAANLVQHRKIREDMQDASRLLHDEVKAIRARLPWRPWMLPFVGIGLVAVLISGIVSFVRMDSRSRANEKCVGKLEDSYHVQALGIVQIKADLGNLMDAREVPRSRPHQWRSVARDMGLALPDSLLRTDSAAMQDSPPPGGG